MDFGRGGTILGPSSTSAFVLSRIALRGLLALELEAVLLLFSGSGLVIVPASAFSPSGMLFPSGKGAAAAFRGGPEFSPTAFLGLGEGDLEPKIHELLRANDLKEPEDFIFGSSSAAALLAAALADSGTPSSAGTCVVTCCGAGFSFTERVDRERVCFLPLPNPELLDTFR